MVSLNTTAANSAVLASLRQINQDIAQNQTRIGTGLKINKSSDNPALFATAQSIRSNITAQDKLAGDLGIAKGKFDAANASIDKITELLNKIKTASDDATISGASGSALTAVIGKITGYMSQITGVAASAKFQGTNLVTTAGATTVKWSNETGASASFTAVDATGAAAMTALTGADKDDLADVTALSALADAAIGEISGYQAKIAAFGETIASQLDFQTTLKGINETALGSIVNANLEEESAKSSALQVRQQLAYQALAIGNNSAQNVLMLFR
ncbi:flagellin [Aureimonas sp. AU22]|uniref:flagellin n=1 Tax=Aureimonas sp. AU22 TaxID=1638162 RepID=UPI0007843A76|nr:flagellin [Aureimonas sp. AU22]